jgi:hypothetical protein
MGKLFMIQDQTSGNATMELFRLPREEVRNSMSVELSASSATLNRDTRRQEALTLMQAAGQYYTQVIGIGTQMIQSMSMAPQAVPVLGGILDRGAELFQRFLESFDVPDAERYVVRQDELQQGLGGTVPSSSPVGSLVGGITGVPQQAGVPGVGTPQQY